MSSRTLADINDDITYLKVKLRREGAVPREDYTSVRDRLETLRIRRDGPTRHRAAIAGRTVDRIVTVPVGTQFDVRLQTPSQLGHRHHRAALRGDDDPRSTRSRGAS